MPQQTRLPFDQGATLTRIGNWNEPPKRVYAASCTLTFFSDASAMCPSLLFPSHTKSSAHYLIPSWSHSLSSFVPHCRVRTQLKQCIANPTIKDPWYILSKSTLIAFFHMFSSVHVRLPSCIMLAFVTVVVQRSQVSHFHAPSQPRLLQRPHRRLHEHLPPSNLQCHKTGKANLAQLLARCC